MVYYVLTQWFESCEDLHIILEVTLHIIHKCSKTVQREILLWTIGNTKFYATEVGYDLYIHKYCTDWLCLAAEKCKFVTCKWWTYVMLPADSFHAFFNTVIFIFIVFDRGHIVCVKYVNQMLILYLYADKLEPSVIPEVELCSLNILTVSGADNYTLC